MLGASKRAISTLRALIDKVKKLDAVSWKVQCKFERGTCIEHTLTMEGKFKGRDRARVDWTLEAEGMASTGLHVIDGKHGWIQREDGVHELPEAFLGLLNNILHAVRLAQMPLLLRDKAYALAPLGEIKIAVRRAWGIKAVRKGFLDTDVFFDFETGGTVKCQLKCRVVKDGPEFTYALFFIEPKLMGGVKHFSKVALYREGEISLELDVT